MKTNPKNHPRVTEQKASDRACRDAMQEEMAAALERQIQKVIHQSPKT